MFGTGCGIVFELNPSNGFFKTLWQFTGGTDGAQPTAELIVSPGGVLYGSTWGGGGVNHCENDGTGGCGTLFRLLPPVSPPRSIQEDHWIRDFYIAFMEAMKYPAGSLVIGPHRNLYGSTAWGGSGGGGVGAVFEATPSHGTWNESVLHNFSGNDGAHPYGGVILDAASNIYGTTSSGGSSDFGVVYQLLATSGWMENTLYNFTGGSDGYGLFSAVTLDSSGNLYSTTDTAGVEGGGTAFQLSGGSWSFHLLHSFSGSNSCGPNRSPSHFRPSRQPLRNNKL